MLQLPNVGMISCFVWYFFFFSLHPFSAWISFRLWTNFLFSYIYVCNPTVDLSFKLYMVWYLSIQTCSVNQMNVCELNNEMIVIELKRAAWTQTSSFYWPKWYRWLCEFSSLSLFFFSWTVIWTGDIVKSCRMWLNNMGMRLVCIQLELWTVVVLLGFWCSTINNSLLTSSNPSHINRQCKKMNWAYKNNDEYIRIVQQQKKTETERLNVSVIFYQFALVRILRFGFIWSI